MATPDLQAKSVQAPICCIFEPHLGTKSPSKLSLKFLYQKLYQKICNNFADTYDMVLKFCWLIDMTKMNIHL